MKAIGEHSGTFIAYLVETKGHNEAEWTRSDTYRARSSHGVPYPCLYEGILLATHGALGYEQAMTIAWGILAQRQGDILNTKHRDVRVRPVQVRYSISDGDKEFEPLNLTDEAFSKHLVEKEKEEEPDTD